MSVNKWLGVVRSRPLRTPLHPAHDLVTDPPGWLCYFLSLDRTFNLSETKETLE